MAAGHAQARPVWLLAPDMPDDISAWLLRSGGSGRELPRQPLDRARTVSFGARAVLRLEPDLGLASCYAPHSDGVATPSPPVGTVLLLRPSNGVVEIVLDTRRATLSAREAILIAADARVRLSQVDRLDYLMIAAEHVTPAMQAAAQSLRTFPEDDDALRLLGSFGAALLRGLMPVGSAALGAHASTYMSELVDLMCSVTARPALQPDEGPAAPRLNAIRADIEVHLDDREMSAAQMAATHGLSVRSLQKLFEAEGETFSGFVLQRRLDRAMRLLQSRPDARSISDIAFEVGFGDLSYFNRTFRKRYGMSPRLARSHHRSVLATSEGKRRES